MRFAISLLITLCICACSPKSNNDKPQGVLSDAQKKTLEKSKQTEEVIQQADKQRKENVGEE